MRTLSRFLLFLRASARLILKSAFLSLLAILPCSAQVTPDNYDVLFLKCDGTNNQFVDSSTANPKTVSANGNATQLPIKFNRTAGFFNGTTDYVVVPDSSDFDLGSADFTWEGFYNFSDVNAYSTFFGRPANGTFMNAFFHHLDKRIEWNWGGTNNRWNFDPSANVWYHIKFRRNGNNCYITVNGVNLPVSVGGVNSNALNSNGNIWIGYDGDAALCFKGWMKEIRFSKVDRGTTVPTTQYDRDPDTLLLMHFDSPATSPLGPAIYFDGAGDYLSVADSPDWDFGANPFTIELSYYSLVDAGSKMLVDIGGYASGVTILDSGNDMYVYVKGTVYHGYALGKNRWQHIAVSRNANVLYIFINGVLLATQDVTGKDITGLSSGVTIGANVAGGENATWGFVREIRISNTARYTSSFTPSQTGFTVDSNTKLYIEGDEKNGAKGKSTNLAAIPNFITWSWIVNSSQGSDPSAISWPANDTVRNIAIDGDKNTSSIAGCSIGSSSGYYSGYLRATLPSSMTIDRVYVKGNGAREEGNASGNRLLSFRVNGTEISSTGTAQGSPSEIDSYTGWSNVTTVDMGIYANYSRPSGGGFAYGIYYEFEIYGVPNGNYSYIKDYSTNEKAVTLHGDAKIEYTEDYRSCIFMDETGKSPYPQGSAKVDFFAAFGSGAIALPGIGLASYLSISNQLDFKFGAGDWTIETYFRPRIFTGNQPGLLDLGGYYSNGGIGVTFYPTFGTLYPYAQIGGAMAVTPPVALNTWHHLVLARSAGVLLGFVNGCQLSPTYADTYNYQPSGPVRIGNDNVVYPFDGLMDNIRISKGIARYTNTFNPPEDVVFSTFTVSPTNTLDFGVVPIGATQTLPFQLSMSGVQPVTGTASTTPPFSIQSGSPFTIPTGGVATVYVSFSPTNAGFFTNTVTFTSSAGTVTRTVTGQGVTDLSDDDADGIPNYWETFYGLNPTNSTDANLQPVIGGVTNKLTYLQIYRFGLDPRTLDFDNDGLTDYDELFVYGTNPFVADTDGDGMPDAWEVAHGLNPRGNDANDDLDRDGLSNLAEYTWSQSHTNQPLDPSRAFSLGGLIGDYQVVTGVLTNRFYYDKNDRLIGGEYANGLAIAYVYDGNNNLLEQVYSARQTETSCLPSSWLAKYGLTGTNAATANGLYDDPDGDGWSNCQEWRGGSNPAQASSVPTNALQTAPITSILPDPSLGNGLATNLVRLWDGEGNSSWLEMQFQPSGTTNWTNITIVSIDGNTYGVASAPPSGATHQVVWNAAQQLGLGVTNNLLLQARARDVTLTGAWSPSASYRVEIPGNDLPSVALTNPTSGAVFLAPATITIQVSASDVDGQVVKVEFFSGADKLGSSTNAPYQFIWSNVPAGVYTLFATATDDLGATNISLMVTITNRQPGPIRLESPQSTNGYFSLLIQGEAGQAYDVQLSSNLTDWATIATVTNNTGSVPYTEPVPTNTARRYYRAKVTE